MSMRFDDIAKGLATEQISRRRALGKVAAGLAVAIVPETFTSGSSATIFDFCFPDEHKCGNQCCKAHQRCCQDSNQASCCKHGQHCYKGRCQGKCSAPHHKPCGALYGTGFQRKQVCCSHHEKCCVYSKTGHGTCIHKSRVCCPDLGSAAGPLTCPPHTVCSGSTTSPGSLGCCTSNQVVCGGDCCDAGYKCCLNPNGNGNCYDPMTFQCCIINGSAYLCFVGDGCSPDSCPALSG